MNIVYPYNEILPKKRAHDVFIFHQCQALARISHKHSSRAGVTLLCGRGSKENRSLFQHYEVAETKNLYKRLKVFRSKGRRVLFSPSTLDYVINYPLPYNKIILRGNKKNEKYYTQMCPFGQTMFYVDSNGDFYPCAALWNGEYFTPKNVLIDSFQDAWENMANLKCVTCFCPGVPEWNRIMSIKGLFSGVKLSLKQMAIKKTKEM